MCGAGSRGTGPDQLDRPRGVAVSASGDVYVANDSNHRIDEFTQAGAFVRAFGQGVNATDSSDICDATTGCQAGNASDGAAAIAGPTGVAVSGSSDVYVADDSNHRIDEFSPDWDVRTRVRQGRRRGWSRHLHGELPAGQRVGWRGRHQRPERRGSDRVGRRLRDR